MILRRFRGNSIFIEGERRSLISMAQARLSFLGGVFVLLYIVVFMRMVDLSVVQGAFVYFSEQDNTQGQQVREIASRRGSVYDRHGFLVASTIKTPSLYVDPALVLDARQLEQELVKIFPEVGVEKIARTVNAKNRFGWIKRGITPAQQEAVLRIGSPALSFQNEYKRIYPQGDLFAHMLGFTNRDGLGLSGIERGYDDVLGAGEDVVLSLDLRLQHVVHRELTRAIEDFEAKAGTGIVMDAKTGEVLAAVSYPDFDLNMARTATNNEKFNRLTLGVYELGSMFKIFSTAALIDLTGAEFDKEFDARKPIRIGRFMINDYHAQKRIMTLPEVFMYSSNIGSALMGQELGSDALRGFYDDLGLFSKMHIAVKEVGTPILPSPWREANTLTATYGHGVATTPMQMTSAVASVVNGGTLVHPKLVKQTQGNAFDSEVRVISEETSDAMRKLLRLVVKEGTGKKADVIGYEVGGKTGTAEKSVNGKYSRNTLISSFVGAFPMSDPRYVVMVMVDEPKGQKHSYGYATAGWVAAPAFGRIVTSIASILGIPADQYDPSQDLSNELLQYVHDPKKEKMRGASLVSY